MKKNKVITIFIILVMILATAFVLMKTDLISKVFKLKADTNQIVLQENEAMFKTGEELNIKIKLLANGEYASVFTEDQNITKMQRANSLNITPTEDNIVSIDSGKPIYMWYANGTIYYYTEASKIYLNPDSSYIFRNLRVLTNLNLSSLDTSKVTSMKGMFVGCSSLKTLDLSSFNTSNVTNMSDMFSLCPSLTNIIFGDNFNTSKVKYMTSMFSSCNSLTSLNLSNFDTSNVANMSGMFRGCSTLTSLNLSNFNTSNVTDMSSMFIGCNSLTSLNLSGFNTNNVTSMYGMFYNCSSLLNLNLSLFNTSRVTNMSGMFRGCSALTSLNISGFNTNNVTNMSEMFYECRALTSLNISGFNTSKVTNMVHMFYGCSKLTSLNLSNFDTSSVTDMSEMFRGCSSLTTLDLSNFYTPNVTNMKEMFRNCSAITNIDVSHFNTSKVTDMSEMFYGCTSLTNLNLSSFNTSNVTSMVNMFYECESLTSLNLSSFDTSNVTSMVNIFRECESLKSIDISSFNTSKVTSMSGMFYNCRALTSITFGGKFDTSNVTNMSRMFSNCGALTSITFGGKFDTSNVINMSFMFHNCESLTSLNLSNFDTSSVTDMSEMFQNCKGLTSLDLSSFNTSKVTNMSYMFCDCESLTSLNLSSFDTSKVTDMSGMFWGCSSLTILNLSSFDTSNVTGMMSMFYNCSNLKTIYVSSKFKTTSVSMNYGSTINMFSNCQKLTGQNGTKYSSSNDHKTYARIDKEGAPGYFSQITYNILYDGNGANEGIMPIDVHAYQEEKALLKNIFVKVGYIFTGWNTKIDGSGTSYKDEQSVINLTDENGKIITLYAQWIKGTYKLTFDANGGTVSVPSMDVTYGSTYTNLPTPTKTGYVFKGWYYDLTKENDYINYGRDYMYTDKLSVHVSVYMDNWSNYGNAISSTQYGGFNIETKDGYIRYSSYDSKIGYKQASSTVLWSSLESGWHDFDIIFDGNYVYGYLDGEKIATSEKYESGKIGYNASNSIFVGAEADISATTPYSSEFNGYVGNVVIKNESNLTLSSTYNTIIAPAQDVTLYARWEEREVDLSDLDIRENKVVFKTGKTLEEIKTQVGTNDIILKDAKGNVKADTSKLGTGDTLTIGTDTYNISVKGDVTGDGEIKFPDITTAYRCFKNKQGFTQEQILAIDIDDNSKIGFNDITSMYGMFKKSR